MKCSVRAAARAIVEEFQLEESELERILSNLQEIHLKVQR